MKYRGPPMRWCDCCGQPVDGAFIYPVEAKGVRLDGNLISYGDRYKRLLNGSATLFRLLVTRGRVSHEMFEAVKETESLFDQSTVYVCLLRKALVRIHGPLTIHTIYGWGYRLVDAKGEPITAMDKASNYSYDSIAAPTV